MTGTFVSEPPPRGSVWVEDAAAGMMGDMEPTEDTPAERDDKATRLATAATLKAKLLDEERVLRAMKIEKDRQVSSLDLARQLYAFRWEMRVMYAVAIVLASAALLFSI